MTETSFLDEQSSQIYIPLIIFKNIKTYLSTFWDLSSLKSKGYFPTGSELVSHLRWDQTMSADTFLNTFSRIGSECIGLHSEVSSFLSKQGQEWWDLCIMQQNNQNFKEQQKKAILQRNAWTIDHPKPIVNHTFDHHKKGAHTVCTPWKLTKKNLMTHLVYRHIYKLLSNRMPSRISMSHPPKL